jgi:adenylate kinase family enzyme
MANSEKDQLFRKYPVAIMHLRQQLKAKRLGLVLGAGIGVDLGFPSWDQLVSNIAQREEVDGESLKEYVSGNTITTQLLFQCFMENYLKNDFTGERLQNYEKYGDIEIRKEWKKLVHDVLYANVPDKIDDIIARSKYLLSLVELIQETEPMTVTYNFDDTIERVLFKLRNKRKAEQESRGYTVVWDPNVQTEKRPNIVYHPNGYLPKKISEFASEQLIFLEDTFEDQLIDSFRGHYNALNNHYSSKTCLFVGISLSDRTLKHMLRMNSKKCFGHTHYLIQYVRDDIDINAEQYKEYVETLTKTNFNTYNLFTMFLTSEEIKTLTRLLLMDDFNFGILRDKITKMRKLFIMGAVAVGKSTTVNQFKCLQTYDEWLEEMPDDMEKSPDLPKSESIERIDKWIAEQINLKNDFLFYATETEGHGLSIIDRTPLDAFAFTSNDEWKAKSDLILSRLPEKGLMPGKVVLLKGDITEMMKRAIQKFRDYSKEALEEQQKKFEHIARGLIEAYPEAITTIDVTDKSIEQVTKEVAMIIYFDEYEEVDFQKILMAIQEKGYDFYE